ncbi:hypothetical protein [Brochothrix thermosphacta]|uniref:hypothetical protein n=1 Tax=Brochothrix thermosphacta TaxID=2756 RepID=UPI00083F9658|nr:hypothetical protein [Brochothrix thermosphacta]ODJ52570.1 hypothetical protein BFR41_10720 [Brochothrix thermosphacta]ODJ69335.1 hypothetical protein BFR43_11340 [Brochothrix thermosphacta]SPN75547.1 conserved hypothetical protein [Brochothrix thermosphacta]
MKKIYVDLQSDRVNISSYNNYKNLLEKVIETDKIDLFFDDRDISLDYYIERIFPELYSKSKLERSEFAINYVLDIKKTKKTHNYYIYLKNKIELIIDKLKCEFIDRIFVYGISEVELTTIMPVLNELAKEFNFTIGQVSWKDGKEIYTFEIDNTTSERIVKSAVLNYTLSYYNLVYVVNSQLTGRKINNFSEETIAILELSFHKLNILAKKFNTTVPALIIKKHFELENTQSMLINSNTSHTFVNVEELEKIEIHENGNQEILNTINFIEKVLAEMRMSD